MGVVKHAVRLFNSGGFDVPVRRQPPLVVGYEYFRLDRQGQLLSPKTLIYYEETVLPFLRWLEADGVRRFDEVDVGRVRTYRAYLATTAYVRFQMRHLQPISIGCMVEARVELGTWQVYWKRVLACR